MKVIKVLFYTVVGIILGLFVLGFCTAIVRTNTYDYSNIDYHIDDDELKSVYGSTIEDELINDVKYYKGIDKKKEEKARQKLRRYRWDREIEHRINESEEWRKREGRKY